MERQLIEESLSLERFVTAQDGVFEIALREIGQGRKRTHWMWFIFPQLRGLGQSDMAHRYGLAALDEAVSFLQHPILGARLRLAVSTLQALVAATAEEVFGSVDAAKFKSCLTLFDEADDSGRFAAALHRWFSGQKDEATLALIAGQEVQSEY